MRGAFERRTALYLWAVLCPTPLGWTLLALEEAGDYLMGWQWP